MFGIPFSKVFSSVAGESAAQALAQALSIVVAAVITALSIAWNRTPLEVLATVLEAVNVPARALTDFAAWVAKLPFAADCAMAVLLGGVLLRAFLWSREEREGKLDGRSCVTFWLASAAAVELGDGLWLLMILPLVIAISFHTMYSRCSGMGTFYTVSDSLGAVARVALAPAGIALLAIFAIFGLDKAEE